MTSIVIIIGIFLLVLLLLSLDIHLEIYNIDKDTDLNIKYGFIKFHLDYDKTIKKYSGNKELKDLISELKNLKKRNYLINKIIKVIRIEDLKIKISYNTFNDILKTYFNATSLIFLSFLKAFLESNTKEINNYETNIICNDSVIDKSLEVDYHLKLKINIKDILINILRRNKYEPSHS